MFLEDHARGEQPLHCTACDRVLGANFVIIEGTDADGTYCAPCARPILSVLRALRTLQRGWQ